MPRQPVRRQSRHLIGNRLAWGEGDITDVELPPQVLKWNLEQLDKQIAAAEARLRRAKARLKAARSG
jgi:hypothetical protein